MNWNKLSHRERVFLLLALPALVLFVLICVYGALLITELLVVIGGRGGLLVIVALVAIGLLVIGIKILDGDR